jgi:hypothetical protein
MDVTNKDRRFLLNQYLNKLEPGGAKGDVRLGYSMTVMPYHFMSRTKTGWDYNPKILDRMLKAALKINRPFVMGFTANHFQGDKGELINELMKDPKNLLHYQDGSIPKEGYFGAELIPFAITDDESVPVAKIKFDVLRAASKQLFAFYKRHPDLLVAVTLNGETHYLFKDFYTGTGNFESPKLTDFSEREIQEFASYLEAKKSSLKAADIMNVPFTQFETGFVPVSGWIESLAPKERIALYLDGVRISDIPYGLNRMDVYDYIPAPNKVSPNTGFQTMLDVSELLAGQHRVDVVIEADGAPAQLIGTRSIEIVGAANQNTAEKKPTLDTTKLAPVKIRNWLDWPRLPDKDHKDPIKISYLPLAREWMEFREQKINAHINKMAGIVREAGFTPQQIYSYQLAPSQIGNWNPLLFGVNDSFFKMEGLRPGVNVYGGNMLNEKLFELFDKSKGYAIPETHPQMEAAPDFAARSLNFHYCNGASFLSPYFLSAEKDPGTSDHDKMMISPKNTRWGSADYYHALIDFVRY